MRERKSMVGGGGLPLTLTRATAGVRARAIQLGSAQVWGTARHKNGHLARLYSRSGCNNHSSRANAKKRKRWVARREPQPGHRRVTSVLEQVTRREAARIGSSR